MDIKPAVIEDFDSVWLAEMVHQVTVLGKRSQNGFKPEAWKACAAKLATINIVRSVKQLKERYRYVCFYQILLSIALQFSVQLKNRFTVYFHLKKRSGWGWDNDSHRPENPDHEAWEE